MRNTRRPRKRLTRKPVVNPPGTKFARRLLQKKYGKQKALYLLGVRSSNPEISPNERTLVEGLPFSTLLAELQTPEKL